MQNFAARRRVSETSDDTRRVGREPLFVHVALRSQRLSNEIGGDRHLISYAARNPRRHRTTDSADLPLQLAHSRLVRVIVNEQSQRFYWPFDLVGFKSVFGELTRNEITFSDLQFLAFGISGEIDQLHPIQERSGDSTNVIGRRDEDDLRKVERDIQITIDEGLVLPWIEYLEQCAGRVAAKIGADLVDFIKHHDRVARAGPSQFLNNATRHRTDVGAAVPANLRFVTNPAQTHPHKLSPERVGHGLTQARFPDAWRTQQTENWSLTKWVEFADREIFNQPAFHFGQVIMIAIENLLGFVEVEIVLAQFRPGQLCDRLDITDNHRILGAGWRDNIEPL